MTRPPPIDLGVLPPRGTDDAPEPPGRPGGSRPWLAAAVAVMVLLTTHAAAPAPPSWAVHQFTGRGQLLAIDRDALYLLRQNTYNRQTLVAYPLAKGEPEWEVTREVGRDIGTDDQGRALMRHAWFTLEGGLPLYVTSTQVGDTRHVEGTGGRIWRPDTASTTAFDPHTGRVRWTRDGLPIGITSGDLLLLEDWTDSSGLRGKAAVHPPTGETVWSIHKPAGTSDHDQHVLANHSDDGHLTTYDLAGGERVATVQTSLAPTQGALVRDDLVLLWRREPWPSVVAYDADGLAQRWSADLPVERVSGSCWTVVCVHGPQGVSVLDPRTGAELWSFDWPAPGRHTAQELAGGAPRGWLLLHQRAGPDHEVRTWVAEGRTGEFVLDITGWHHSAGDGHTRLMRKADFGGPTWFGELSLDPPGVEVLGSLGSITTCNSAGPRLACQTGTEVEVWLLPR